MQTCEQLIYSQQSPCTPERQAVQDCGFAIAVVWHGRHEIPIMAADGHSCKELNLWRYSAAIETLTQTAPLSRVPGAHLHKGTTRLCFGFGLNRDDERAVVQIPPIGVVDGQARAAKTESIDGFFRICIHFDCQAEVNLLTRCINRWEFNDDGRIRTGVRLAEPARDERTTYQYL